MSEPIIAAKEPATLELEPGTYYWCACGKSKKQPFCDGSHKGSEFTPKVLEITEGTQISEQAVGYPATPGIYNQQQVDGWKQSTDAVHTKSGRIFAQLWHCGRISPINAFNDMSDSKPQSTFNHVVTSLSGLGLAFLHVVEVDMTGQSSPNFNMQQLRDRFDGLYIANGGYDKSRGNQSLAEARADLVAFGVPFLANPDLPERFRIDSPLNEADQATFYGGDEHGYTDYPALGGN